MNWKVLAGVFLVLYVSVTNTKEIRDTATNIQNGLSLAKELGDLIVNKDFTNVIGKVATAVTPFLGIIGPLVSFVMGFIGKAESPELKLKLKKLYTEVDNRFDQVDSEFNEVKKLIDWSTIKVQFSSIELNIIAADTKLKDIYTFSTSSLMIAKSNFLRSYESNYHDSGLKLYEGIMSDGRVFGDSILSAVMTYTKYDRKQCQTFMLGLLKLLLKAAKVEVSYHQLKGQAAALHDYQNQWKNRFTHIRIKMLSTDSSIVSQYHTQSGIYIDDYLTKHLKNTMNNNDFNNGLYAVLAKKYYWRDWFLVTYNDIKGWDVHAVGQCGGHIKFRNHGRNVVVASVDHNQGHINMAQAQTIVNSVDACRTVYSFFGYPYQQRTDCEKAYNTFPASVRDHCSPYAAQGVISYTMHNGNDVHFKAAVNRMYVRRQENCNFVYVFG